MSIALTTIPPPYESRTLTYRLLWEDLRLNKVTEIDRVIADIFRGESRYRLISRELGVPAHVVGIIHSLECSCNFNLHLFNGDPLTDRTVRVPKGYPKVGEPPFTWEESAIAALTLKGLQNVKDWSIEGTLYRLEAYNGWGYVPTAIYSPYLWSYTNIYESGKYVRDGIFDPRAVSGQAGAAAIMRRMLDRRILKNMPSWV